MRRRTGWKRGIWLTTMAAVAVFLACETSISLVDIEESADVVIPSSGTGKIEFTDLELDFGEGFDPMESEEMQQYGGPAAAVGEAFLTEATLKMLKGDEYLDFLDSIAFYIEAPGMDRILLAQEEDVPLGRSAVALSVHDDKDISEYAIAGLIQPVVVMSGVEPNEESTVKMEFSINMGVSMASACEEMFSGE